MRAAVIGIFLYVTSIGLAIFLCNLKPLHAASWSSYRTGTLIASLKDKKLYHVISRNKVKTYPIGTPRKGVARTMTSYVSWKRRKPGWSPTANQRRRDKSLPGFVKGGSSKNPLGAAALYLGTTMYRIHGTNEPHSIGRAMSDGCIRMRDRDIKRLYKRVRPRAPVIITWKSYRHIQNSRKAALLAKAKKRKANKTIKLRKLKRAKALKKRKALKTAKAKSQKNRRNKIKLRKLKRADTLKKSKALKTAKAKSEKKRRKKIKLRKLKRAKALKKMKALKTAKAKSLKNRRNKIKLRKLKRAKALKKMKALKTAKTKSQKNRRNKIKLRKQKRKNTRRRIQKKTKKTAMTFNPT